MTDRTYAEVFTEAFVLRLLAGWDPAVAAIRADLFAQGWLLGQRSRTLRLLT